jgi:hypothetical protein
MIDYELSEHAYDMLRERNIQESWVKLAIEEPEIKEFKDDGTVHYIRAIERAIEYELLSSMGDDFYVLW